MTLKLIFEHMPTPQQTAEWTYHGGQMSIGRGDDADWQIDDPEKYVSRKHLVVSDETGQPMVTDASTGGLFVDGASEPLGAGNAVPLEDGMRLRFGDFVMRVEAEPAGRTSQAKIPKSGGLSFDFGAKTDAAREPKVERPGNLPAPFGAASRETARPMLTAERAPPRPLDDDDPFALDLASKSHEGPVDIAPKVSGPQEKPISGGYFGSFDAPVKPTMEAPAIADPTQMPEPLVPSASPQPSSPGLDAFREAYFRGLGTSPDKIANAGTPEEIEALGRHFRALVDGLVHLLRTRAQEKQNVRVAQTIIGSTSVNPLKFALSTDDAIEALLQNRGKGYMESEEAIHQSYRDLADHQVRTWSALQSALRRMIDRFDPEKIEREMDDTGLLEALLAGGRHAKLWKLYEARYREIARSAEDRFLGEVGADFRDAYENEGRD